jgi:DNA-binding NarL/FixJ family response regulator
MQVSSMEFADSRIPAMEEKRGYDYIPFGDRNDYPNYLLWLYNKSAKHNAIINGKCVYILGNGLTSEDEQGKLFLKKANEKQSWDELIKMACLDIENFGGCYFQVIPKLIGGYNYYHIAYDKIRTNEHNTCFYYKKKWENNLVKAEKEYPAFNPTIKETSIFYYKEYRCGKAPYALPTWVAAANYIESDIEVSRHTLTNAKTGFSASKFINFYNGEPDEKKKAGIQARLENAATGAEGKKLLIAFNNDPAKKPTIDDLGASDMTKEDFTQVDNLITNNIITGHNVTNGMLFAIQQEGKLGGATELKTAFEIFKSTYVNYKQRNIETLVKYFSKVAGIDVEYKIKDIVPVGIELNPLDFKELLPKAWVLEKLGIDVSKYEPQAEQLQAQQGNDALVNISGRQQQNLLRIVRLFTQGKLSKNQAAIQLQAYGFTTEQINQYLGVEEQFSADDEDEYLANMFAECGYNRDEFDIVSSSSYDGSDDDFVVHESFADYTEREMNVLELLKKQPELDNNQIAEALKLERYIVTDIITNLIKNGAIKLDGTIRKVTERIPAKQLPEIKVVYTYEKRSIAEGPTLLPTSRKFCVRLVALSESGKVWSIKNIQDISQRVGYSVFKRCGGFWNNNGVIEYQCRHEWVKHIVIKKQK